MTGNAVVSGLALGGVHPLDAGHTVIAIGTFVFGVMLGTLLRDARVTLLLETLVLGTFALLWQLDRASDWSGLAVLIAIGAGAMGLQTAATRRTHGGGSSSTYMSGTLARAAADGVEALSDPAKALSAVFSGATFLVYLLAAIGVGGLAARNTDVLAVVPLASLVIVLAVAIGVRLEKAG
jgi:uncharacterized membrane protein YoaK (UPF0700 family)